MKLSPNTKLNIVFWTITAPMVPLVILLLLCAMIISIIPPCRNWAFNVLENIIQKICIWRNNLSIVKNAYDKAHLFDYIKDSKG